LVEEDRRNVLLKYAQLKKKKMKLVAI